LPAGFIFLIEPRKEDGIHHSCHSYHSIQMVEEHCKKQEYSLRTNNPILSKLARGQW